MKTNFFKGHAIRANILKHTRRHSATPFTTCLRKIPFAYNAIRFETTYVQGSEVFQEEHARVTECARSSKFSSITRSRKRNHMRIQISSKWLSKLFEEHIPNVRQILVRSTPRKIITNITTYFGEDETFENFYSTHCLWHFSKCDTVKFNQNHRPT